MKKINLIAFFVLIFLNSFAQQNDTWVAFWNKDKTLIGFKDRKGNVKIKPTFDTFTRAVRFENIIGVSKYRGEKIDNYYLTKKGRIVGKGNLYIIDNGADCESEGFIRFRDSVTYKVGMLDHNGNIAIPAVYDNMAPVRNGMIMATKGGHWDEHLKSEHNQFPWVGGREVLIDTHNRVLIENFAYNEEINFFSLIVSERPRKNPIYQSFKATNGKYYSFMIFDKEFRNWLKTAVLKNLTRNILLKACYKDVFYSSKSKDRERETKGRFIDQNFELIKPKLLELTAANCDYDIFTEGLISDHYNTKEFAKYFNDCGDAKSWLYPIKLIVINHKMGNNIAQDQFSFLRTDTGYKLIEVSIKN